MSKGKYGLVCVAHPDDETLFFGGLLKKRTAAKGPSKLPFSIVCVTDGNADGQGALRKKQFAKACRALGVERSEWWGFPDVYEKRLDVDELTRRLRELPVPHEIYTHGAIGEYGHPHHQDVCVAVHRAFPDHPRLWASAYNAFPETRIQLSEAEFEAKAKILTKIYGSETQRFLNLLPATSTEGYLRLELPEIEALYAFFAGKADLKPRALKAYRWLIPYLASRATIARPF